MHEQIDIGGVSAPVLPWLASILLDVAVGGDVVQDPAQVIFIISKNPYSTKPMVFERNIYTFFVKPTVLTASGFLVIDPALIPDQHTPV